MIARIGRVDGDDGQVAQVFAVLLAQRQLGGLLRIVQHLLREDVGNAELVNGDKAVAARSQRIAQYVRHFHAGIAPATCGFGNDKLALFRLAPIGHGEGIANTLVHRCQPRLAAAVYFYHAQHLVFGNSQLLHRVCQPAATLFLGTGEDTVPGTQCELLFLLDHPQARGSSAIVGIPAFGHADGFAIVYLDNFQHGYARHAAHAVIGAGLAVDQAFLGHVFQQRLQGDLFLPLQAEMLGDFALADTGVGTADKFHDLILIGQALELLGELLCVFRFIHMPRHMGALFLAVDG